MSSLGSDDGWSNVVFLTVDELARTLGVHPSVHIRKVEGPDGKAVRIGKIEWDRDASRTWNSEPGDFIDLEIYMPQRAELMHKSTVPSVYVHILREVVDESAVNRYGELLNLAMRKSVWKRYQSVAERVVTELGANPNVLAAYKTERRVSSLNLFEDVITDDFSYRGMLMDEMPDVSKMRQKWQSLRITNR